MKRYILAFSLTLNILLIGFFCYRMPWWRGKSHDPFADTEKRLELARSAAKDIICKSLYIPESYDPVNTIVDSAFFCALLDPACIEAAKEIIKEQKEYNLGKNEYETADWELRFHGGAPSVFLEPMRNSRKKGKERMSTASSNIENSKNIIRNRDKSHDGMFIGWAIDHKYRAKNNHGEVSFGHYLIVTNPTMTTIEIIHPIEKSIAGDNPTLSEIKNIIDEILIES